MSIRLSTLNPCVWVDKFTIKNNEQQTPAMSISSLEDTFPNHIDEIIALIDSSNKTAIPINVDGYEYTIIKAKAVSININMSKTQMSIHKLTPSSGHIVVSGGKSPVLHNSVMFRFNENVKAYILK